MRTRSLVILGIVAVAAIGTGGTLYWGSITGSGSELPAEETGSGAVSSIDPEEEALLAEQALREERAEKLQKDLLKAKKEKTEEKWETAREGYAKKRALHDKECRMDMRRANRDALLKTAVRCFRESLTLERDFLRSEKEYVYNAPGVSEEQKLSTLRPIDALLEAIATVIDGLESDVYQNTEELLEAKRNLHALYRGPAMEAFRMLRAEQVLHHIARMEISIDEADAEERATIGSGSMEWTTVFECFHEEENRIETLLANSKIDAETLQEIEDDVRTCIEQLKSAQKNALQRKEEHEKTLKEEAAAASSSSARRRR